ncbi:MAG: GNAT family N-acetyltransferase [Candidatus Odinarchaeota archaeon]
MDDVEKDYEAVMESQELLHAMFGGPWPTSGFTIEENFKDLKRHQKDFLDRKAFTYSVVSLDDSRVLGCLYIKPSDEITTDAVVTMWVRQTEYEKGLDKILFSTVKNWISLNWPFKNVDFPGRK